MCVCTYVNVCVRQREWTLPWGRRQREMSQQLLQCSGSLRNSAACLMHPVLLELTPYYTHILKTNTHTHFLAHGALCFLLLLPLTKRREVSRGMGDRVCFFFFLHEFLSFSLSGSIRNWYDESHHSPVKRVRHRPNSNMCCEFVLITSKQHDTLYSPGADVFQ